jgi:hypothetical protein
MSKRICMTVTILLLMGLIVGTAGAINSAYPVKMVELGETIPYDQAYNLDPYNIVPADTMAICHMYEQENYDLTKGDYRYLLNCVGRNPVDPDGSRFRYLGAHFDSHNPAPVGEYYAISNTSPIGDYNAVLIQIQNDPQAFRDAHYHLYTVLPDPVPTTAPTPVPTTVPTTEPTVNYQATIAAIEAKVTAHETQIAEIRETLAAQTPVPTPTPTPEPTPTLQSMPAPTTTPSPTPTIDYDARIAELDKRIAEAEEQARKQDDLIYQIMKFLGLT